MKRLLTVLFLASGISSAVAQPTFTSSDFVQLMSTSQSSDQYVSQDVSGLAALVSTSGPNATWTLGDRTFTKSTSTSSFPNLQPVSSSIPFGSDPDFATATHYEKKVSTNATEYSFYRIAADGFYFVGAGDDSTNGKQGKLVLTPPAQFAKFPMTYGTTWSTTSAITGTIISSPGATWVQSGNCDGWGTLVTPSQAHSKNQINASEQCLRVKTTQKFGLSYMGIFYGSSTYDIKFYGQGSHSMDITTDANDVPSKVSYQAPAGTNAVSNSIPVFSSHLASNPSSGLQSAILITATQDCQAEVTLYDALGRECRRINNVQLVDGENRIEIDQRALQNGSYIVRISAEGHTSIEKLIIAK